MDASTGSVVFGTKEGGARGAYIAREVIIATRRADLRRERKSSGSTYENVEGGNRDVERR